MTWPTPADETSAARWGNTTLAVAGLTLLIVVSLGVLLGQPAVAIASDAHPVVRAVGRDVTPTLRPLRPQGNPVSSSDATVVRPDHAAGDGVNGLPASGIGFTVPADDGIQRWTKITGAALTMNALILLGVAVWSVRRRRIQRACAGHPRKSGRVAVAGCDPLCVSTCPQGTRWLAGRPGDGRGLTGETAWIGRG